MSDRLQAVEQDLTGLAHDLDGMQEHLKKKIDELNGIVSRIESGWRSPAARAYQDLQRGVNEDAVTIRKNLILIEEAVRMSRDGFSAQDLETMRQFQRIKDTETGEQTILGMADNSGQQGASPAPPRSALHDL